MTDLFLLSERQMARIKVAGSASCSSSLQARSMIANISVDEAPLVRGAENAGTLHHNSTSTPIS